VEFLGCSITQTEYSVHQNFFTPITPMAEGKVVQVLGDFYHENLSGFPDRICQGLPGFQP
jgi:hypothetical protein